MLPGRGEAPDGEPGRLGLYVVAARRRDAHPDRPARAVLDRVRPAGLPCSSRAASAITPLVGMALAARPGAAHRMTPALRGTHPRRTRVPAGAGGGARRAACELFVGDEGATHRPRRRDSPRWPDRAQAADVRAAADDRRGAARLGGGPGRPDTDIRFETFGSSGAQASGAVHGPARGQRAARSWCRRAARCSTRSRRRGVEGDVGLPARRVRDLCA